MSSKTAPDSMIFILFLPQGHASIRSWREDLTVCCETDLSRNTLLVMFMKSSSLNRSNRFEFATCIAKFSTDIASDFIAMAQSSVPRRPRTHAKDSSRSLLSLTKFLTSSFGTQTRRRILRASSTPIIFPSLKHLITNKIMALITPPPSTISLLFLSFSSARASILFKVMIFLRSSESTPRSPKSLRTCLLSRAGFGVGILSIPLHALAIHHAWISRRRVWFGVRSESLGKGCFVTGHVIMSTLAAAVENHFSMLSLS
ncbi:hypothetical protein PanWU01x14_220340 [Parasponia andersonii]|uniref:Uncharacterized protein n=1 Tax=Parasponia andersonii TaxID=3476 RepID=A0A2P5BQ29_PARAD|nr:hypothetical protein PanWU01x14_220340 [Parasponia andersonii]